MNYLQKHWDILKRSFGIDSLTWKLFITDICFIFTLMLSYTIMYLVWTKNLFSLQNVFEMAQAGQVISASGLSIMQLWNRLIFNIIITLIFTIIIYVLLISIYGALSHKFISKKGFNLRLLLNFLYVNSILTITYLLLILAIFYLSISVKLAVWFLLIVTFLYIYSLMIFYLITKDDKLSKIFVHGFKSMLKLHHTLVPIILYLLLIAICSAIIYVVSFGSIVISTVLAVITFFYLLTWIKKYLHHIIHD